LINHNIGRFLLTIAIGAPGICAVETLYGSEGLGWIPSVQTDGADEAALDYVNQLRSAAGLAPFRWNSALGRAADNHARYLVTNQDTGHDEERSGYGFTGETPWSRAQYAGYVHSRVSEVISYTDGDAIDAIDGLMSAIYHRFGLIDPSNDEIGGATARSGRRSAHVFNLGNRELYRLCTDRSVESGHGSYYRPCANDEERRIAAAVYEGAQRDSWWRNGPEYVVWPETAGGPVPPVFFEEDPDPLPDHDESGYPISITFNEARVDTVKITRFALYRVDDQGDMTPVRSTRFMDAKADPNGLFSAHQFALFPLQRLEWDAKYQVEVDAIVDGRPAEISWAFSTRDAGGPVHRLTGGIEQLHYRPGQPTILDLSVLRRGAGRSEVQYSYGHHNTVTSEFIDSSTVRLDIEGESCTPVRVELNGREVAHLVAIGCSG
jgi:uncharacterized protein YkwD